MKFTVVIPARYASTRLPGKVLADIAGKPMIAHVVERAKESLASRIIVATDDQRIVESLANHDCEVCLTRDDHQSGSDRLAEVVTLLSIPDDEIIVNVQGDEPCVPGRLINQVAEALDKASDAVMSTAAKEITDSKEIDNPNVVKVVFTGEGKALYFSRAPIPYARNKRNASSWHHIGIYAYRSGFLKRYQELPSSGIEQTESLEQIRVLESGENIVVIPVDYDTGIGVDTQQDLELARTLLTTKG